MNDGIEWAKAAEAELAKTIDGSNQDAELNLRETVDMLRDLLRHLLDAVDEIDRAYTKMEKRAIEAEEDCSRLRETVMRITAAHNQSQLASLILKG